MWNYGRTEYTEAEQKPLMIMELEIAIIRMFPLPFANTLEWTDGRFSPSVERMRIDSMDSENVTVVTSGTQRHILKRKINGYIGEA